MASDLNKQLIDWTLFDQYPNHWGAAMTIATVTSALRSCEYGDRENWCDLLSELLEGDPHSHAVLKKCYSGIVNKPWELLPPQCESEAEQTDAKLIAADVTRKIGGIKDWKASLFQLLWGHFNGASAQEIIWDFSDEWLIAKLQLVPSRRIAYDDHMHPYITNGSSYRDGMLFSDYPGKFMLFLPVVTGDSPVREGVGRIIAYWMAFKRWASRDFVGYAERYGKPTPIVTAKTGRESADEKDLVLADTLIANIGRGTQPGARIPDTLTVEFASDKSGTNAGEKTVHASLIALCNAEISKAILGGTLTTEVGSTGGNRSLGERQGDDQEDIQAAITTQLDAMVTESLVSWLVRLNYGDDAMHLCPRYHTKIEATEDLTNDAKILDVLVKAGLRVPASDVYERFGWRAPDGEEEVLGVTFPSSEGAGEEL